MEQVWYAAYGSNLSRARFETYLSGGRPAGGTRTYPGARDRTPPADQRALLLPGQLYFAWESATWTGGVAFYDPTGPTDGVATRAYLLTVQQFSDVAAQEMHHFPGRKGTDLDVHALLRHARSVTLGDGRYETLHRVGTIENLPVVTFSASWTAASAPLNSPSAAYLRMIASGLQDAHLWSAPQICNYLLAAPGVTDSWDRCDLARLITREQLSGQACRHRPPTTCGGISS